MSEWMNPKIQCDPNKNHLFEMKIKKKLIYAH